MSQDRTPPRTSSRGRSIAMATALCLALPIAARAEVRVEGNSAAVRITTSQDSIGNVLTALGPALNVQYRSAITLDAAANPTYSGTIERVIANLLAGFNYVVRKSGGETEIVVLGRSGEVAIPPPTPKTQPTGVLSRWR
jgi:hypothetical protein